VTSKAALAHQDAGGASHLVVGELDRPVPLRIFKLLVFVAADAVELKQPVLKSRTGIDLAGANLARARVPGNDGFRAGTGGEGGDAEDVAQRLFSQRARE